MFYILGSNGLIGQNIKKLLGNKKYKTIGRKKINCDLYTNLFEFNSKNKNSLRNNLWIKEIKQIDTLILLSNFGSIKKYQENKKKVRKFEKAIFFILKNLNKNVKVIFFSTDMVFEGKNIIYRDNSKRKAKNDYGKSKIRIEKFINKNLKNFVILRLCKIYSKNIKEESIFKELNLKLLQNKPVYLFNDQFVHFMEIKDLIVKLKKIFIKRNLVGTFNLPGKLFTTRIKLAEMLFPKKKNKFIPIKAEEKFSFLPLKLKMKSKLKI